MLAWTVKSRNLVEILDVTTSGDTEGWASHESTGAKIFVVPATGLLDAELGLGLELFLLLFLLLLRRPCDDALHLAADGNPRCL